MKKVENLNSQPCPSFLDAFYVWVKVAIYSFGGPTNQIAVMHKLIVEEKKWIDEQRFLRALNYCMLLPGPEAQQLSIYLGWWLHRYWGGITAGVLFIIPGFLTMLPLSIIYTQYTSITFIKVLFYGIKPAVFAIVLNALLRIAKKTLKNVTSILITLIVFVSIFFFNVPFPIIVLSAGLFGCLMHRFFKSLWITNNEKNVTSQEPVQQHQFIIWKTLFTATLWLAIWFLPIILVLLLLGHDNIFAQEGILFSKAAATSVGGSHAIVTYIAQQSVQNYAWLKPEEMLDGLSLAETMPGPLTKVVQFVSYLAVYRHAGLLHPILAGIFGAVITTWVTFIPSFLWIFVGAPYIEQLHKLTVLQSAMKAITAAVVGVILSLTIWFALHTLFHTISTIKYSILQLPVPDWHSLNIGACLIMIYAIIMTFRYHAGLFTVLISSVAFGFLF